MLGLTAEQIGTVILGLSLGIIGLMGGQKGKKIAKGQAPDRDVIEVAGAIVSDKSVTEWVRSTDANTSALTVLARSIDRNTEACMRAADNADTATDEIKVPTRELIRSQAFDRTQPPR